MNRLLLVIIVACLGGAACRERPGPSPPEGGAPSARAHAADWLRTARFEDADPTIDCQPDCREQERGFVYARTGRIEQPGDCDLARLQAHASEDFIEGCRAYGQYLEAAGRER